MATRHLLRGGKTERGMSAGLRIGKGGIERVETPEGRSADRVGETRARGVPRRTVSGPEGRNPSAPSPPEGHLRTEKGKTDRAESPGERAALFF